MEKLSLVVIFCFRQKDFFRKRGVFQGSKGRDHDRFSRGQAPGPLLLRASLMPVSSPPHQYEFRSDWRDEIKVIRKLINRLCRCTGKYKALGLQAQTSQARSELLRPRALYFLARHKTGYRAHSTVFHSSIFVLAKITPVTKHSA